MAGTNVVEAIGASYHVADRKAACQSAVNCFVQRLDGSTVILASAPGEVVVHTLGAEFRGQRNVLGQWFVVAGASLYEMTVTDGVVTKTLRGTLGTAVGFVGMANNNTQLAIVDGANLYMYSLAMRVFTIVSSDGWRGSDDVRELDGYFVFVDPGTDQFYLSAIDDGTNLDALDFSSADSAPDNIVTQRVSHRQLWLFGDFSTEIWIDSGDLDFPFVRYQSYTLDIGIVGKRAAIEAADTLFWVGQTRNGRGLVYMAAGNQPQRVSTIAVEQAIAASTDISGIEMWAYQIEGHEFIGIKAPGMSSTWVFDAALQLWHERAEWFDGWKQVRSGQVMAYQGEHYAGDNAGNLTRLDDSANTLSGRPLVRERTWPHLVSPSLEPIRYSGLEVSAKTGSTSAGNMTLEISNDGGDTFGPPLLRSLGATGQRMARVRWNGLGASFNRVFRLRVSDDVPFALYSAAVQT